MAGGRQFRLDAARLVELCADLTQRRERAGLGSLAQVTEEQMKTACMVIQGVNRAAGWPDRADAGAAEVLGAYLAPVLCDTAATRPLLREALLVRLPGAFDPPYPQPAEPPPPSLWRRLVDGLARRAPRIGRAHLVLPSMAVAALLMLAWLRVDLVDPYRGCADGGDRAAALDWLFPCPESDSGGTTAGGTGTAGGVAPYADPIPAAQVGAGPPTPLRRALVALQRAGHDLTPRQLAERLAGSAPHGLDPGVLLAAMLARHPMPPDQPIPRSDDGALAVIAWSIAAARAEHDRSGESLPLRRFRDAAAPPTAAPSAAQVDPVTGDLAPQPTPSLRSMILATDDLFADFLKDDLATVLDGESTEGLGDGQAFIREALPRDQYAIVLGRAFPDDMDTTEVRDALADQIAGHLGAARQPALAGWHTGWDILPALPALAAAGWLLLGLWRLNRRVFADLPPLVKPGSALVLPFADRGLGAGPSDLRAVARVLRHSGPELTTRIDERRTLTQALTQGRLVTPVWRTRQRKADLAVLIRRGSLGEHEARRVAAQWQALADEGVQLVVYEYATHPGALRPFGQLDSPPLTLEALSAAQPDARLILLTPGDEFGGLGGRATPETVLAQLRAWPERAVLTPVAVAEWGLREHAMERALDAPVIPYGLGAPEALAQQIAPRTRAVMPTLDQPTGEFWLRTAPAGTLHPIRWVGQVQARGHGAGDLIALPAPLRISREAAVSGLPPDTATAERMMLALRQFLGPRGMLWLAACASYPVLRYPLTLWLGVQLFGSTPQPPTDALLARLCRLPWFDTGRLPAWLRQRLHDEMTADQRERVQEVFAGFYAGWDIAEGPRPDGTLADADWRLRLEHDPDLAARIDGVRRIRSDRVQALFSQRAPSEQRRRRALAELLAERGGLLAAAVALSAALFLAWPDRGSLPLPPGSWLPAAGAAAVLALAAIGAAPWLGPALRSLAAGRKGKSG